jgi:ABC-2 type transport system ATP-binding protein
VSKRFAERTVLDQVSFEVQAGELCALLGPNGAGKSTLLRILTGLLPPDAGEAVVGGLPVAGSPAELRRKIGVVPENLALFPELTIEEHLYMSGPIYGLDKHTTRERSKQLLQTLGIYETRHTFAKECSHGMRKKTALAMALLHNPPVLFLDEPFEGVDPVSSETLRQLLESMASRGITVLLTSHILSLVDRVAQRLMLLREGKLVWNSLVSELPGGSAETLYFDLVETPATEELPWLRL